MWFTLFLAFVLRLPFLNQSLWLDEAIQAMALKGYYGPILGYALSDFQPPLYHFILMAWTRLAGTGEVALRIPSLLAGTLLTYYSYQLGSLLKNKQVGLWAALLVATNPLLIYYSQEGRTYIFTTLFVTASYYYLLKLLKNPKSNLLTSISYLLSSVFALYTSYLSWVALAIPLLYLVWQRRWRLVWLSLAAYLTLLPWLPLFLRSLGIGLSDAGAMPEWGRVVGGISPKALALTWVKAVIGRISFSPPWLYASIVSVVFVLHLIVLRQLKLRSLTIDHRPLLLLWLLALPLLALLSLAIPFYSYTRVLFVVPAYLLLLALSLVNRPRLGTVIVSLQLVFLLVFWFSPRFHREDWRGLTSYLNKHALTVAQPTNKLDAPLSYYGLSSKRLVLPEAELGVDRLYYLPYGEDIFDPARAGRANLANSGYTLLEEISFNALPVEIYGK